MRRSAQSRPGFSLIELLVVVVIIGVLMSLLLPAVQAARESARRVSCLNNLRQIGVGLHQYHAALGTFPPGCMEPTFLKSNGRQFGWSALLLPYLEQESLSVKIDFSAASYETANAQAAAILVPVYVCSSRPRGDLLVNGYGPCDYGGTYGEVIGSHPADGSWSAENGMMIYDRAFSARDVSDGTSNTLIVAENSLYPVWNDGQWINGLNIFDQRYAINYIPSNPRKIEDEIRSAHPQGANGAFCDGSARFLRETIDLKTLKAILTRASGDIPGEF